MKRLIDNIQQTLQAGRQLFLDNDVKPVAHFDLFYNQPSMPDTMEWNCPAVFLDYMLDYDNERAYIYLHCIYEDMEETDNAELNRDYGLKYLTFLKLIKHLLKGLKTPPIFSALQLYQDSPMQSEYFHYHTISFSCSLLDDLDDDFPKYINVDLSDYTNNIKLKERLS